MREHRERDNRNKDKKEDRQIDRRGGEHKVAFFSHLIFVEMASLSTS